MNCRSSLPSVLPCRLVKRLATDLKPTVPGADVAQRTTQHRVVSLLGEGADNWATLGGRDLWVESVTLTIDSSHGPRGLSQQQTPRWLRHLPADTAAGDGLAKRYKVPPGSSQGQMERAGDQGFQPKRRRTIPQ